MLRLVVSIFMVGLLQVAYQLPVAVAEVVKISKGRFVPFYTAIDKEKSVGKGITTVESFYLDDSPVTNKAFLDFIKLNPEWSKDKVAKLTADKNYLSHWKDNNSLFDQELSDVPVVNVSWFAADAFCRHHKGRLPSVIEWEYVASADETNRDASKNPQFIQKLLDWYGKSGRNEVSTPIKKSKPNVWKVYDLHGLIWEWNDDFNSVFLSGDNRREGEEMKNMFCGGGALSAADKANYAAFMRYAMRNSLKGNYTTQHLGFRCAYDTYK